MDISIFDSIEEKIIVETGENYFSKQYIKDFDVSIIEKNVLLLKGNLLIEDKSYSSELIVNLNTNKFDTSFCTCDDSGDFCSHRAALYFKIFHDQHQFMVDHKIDTVKFTDYKRGLSKKRFFKSIRKISEKYSIKVILIIEDTFTNDISFRIDFYHEDKKINFYTDISYNEKWDEQRNFNYTLFPMKDRLIVKTINDWFEHIPEEEFTIPKINFDIFMKIISDFPELYCEPENIQISVSKSYFKPKLNINFSENEASIKTNFSKSIKIINGEFNQWILCDKELAPLRIKLSEDVWSFLIKDRIILTQNEIANFYYEIIPKIDHAFEIEIAGDIGLQDVYSYSYFFLCDYDTNIIITPKIKAYFNESKTSFMIIDTFEFNSPDNIFLTFFNNNHYYVAKRNVLQEKKIFFVLKKYNFVMDNTIFKQKDKLFYKSFLEEGINKLKADGEVEFTDNFKKIMIEKTFIFADFSIDYDEEVVDQLIVNETYYLSNGTKLATDAIEKIHGGKRFIESDQALTLIENYADIKKLKDLMYDISEKKVKLQPDYYVSKVHISQFLFMYDEIQTMINSSDQFKITLNLPQKLELMLQMKETFIKKQDISIFKKKIAIPAEVKDILRNYQRFGFFWFYFLKEFNFGGILADDMGLGKTLQIITFIKSLNAAKPSLIICPTSLLHNWYNEVEKFFPGTKMMTIKGGIQERKTQISHINRYEIIITSYSLIRNDIEDYLIYDFECIVLDEANHIKNPNTNISNVVKQLKGNYKFVLTGTPVENNLNELWSIFSFVTPQLLGKFKNFKEYYIDNFDEVRLNELKQKISPFLLRRNKSEVLKELPPKIIQTYMADLSPMQKDLYQEILTDVRENVLNRIRKDGLQKSKIHILTALLKLRQIANHPSLINPSFGVGTDISGKCDLLREIMIESVDSGHKVLIFSQFTNMLGIIRSEIEQLAYEYSYLDGSTPEAKRATEIEKFKTMPSRQLFLISLKAGGYGLNIPEADTVVIFDPWWNPMVEMQAIDRAHRMGQTKTVMVYKLISKDTIEEKIIKLQDKKKKLFDSVVNVNNIFKNLTEEDVEEFFS